MFCVETQAHEQRVPIGTDTLHTSVSESRWDTLLLRRCLSCARVRLESGSSTPRAGPEVSQDQPLAGFHFFPFAITTASSPPLVFHFQNLVVLPDFSLIFPDLCPVFNMLVSATLIIISSAKLNPNHLT